MTPGRRIRSRRRFYRMTQGELGEIAGVSKATIKEIEKDRSDPRFTVMIRICEVLHLDIMDMVKDIKRAPTLNR